MTSVMAGLSSVEASRRLAADGPNQLPEPRRPSALRHLGKQFTHLLAILLWVASGWHSSPANPLSLGQLLW